MCIFKLLSLHLQSHFVVAKIPNWSGMIRIKRETIFLNVFKKEKFHPSQRKKNLGGWDRVSCTKKIAVYCSCRQPHSERTWSNATLTRNGSKIAASQIFQEFWNTTKKWFCCRQHKMQHGALKCQLHTYSHVHLSWKHNGHLTAIIIIIVFFMLLLYYRYVHVPVSAMQLCTTM